MKIIMVILSGSKGRCLEDLGLGEDSSLTLRCQWKRKTKVVAPTRNPPSRRPEGSSALQLGGEEEQGGGQSGQTAPIKPTTNHDRQTNAISSKREATKRFCETVALPAQSQSDQQSSSEKEVQPIQRAAKPA